MDVPFTPPHRSVCCPTKSSGICRKTSCDGSQRQCAILVVSHVVQPSPKNQGSGLHTQPDTHLGQRAFDRCKPVRVPAAVVRFDRPRHLHGFPSSPCGLRVHLGQHDRPGIPQLGVSGVHVDATKSCSQCWYCTIASRHKVVCEREWGNRETERGVQGQPPSVNMLPRQPTSIRRVVPTSHSARIKHRCRTRCSPRRELVPTRQ